MKECPRCWRYTDSINFDSLCDRCVNVILTEHPNHVSVPLILKHREDSKELEIKDH